MDDLARFRLNRLIDYCQRRGLFLKADGKISPTKLASAKLIDGKPWKSVTYISDLLSGRGDKKFGASVAREFEETIGMPKWHLDGDSDWPFPDIGRARFDKLKPNQQIEIQGAVRREIERFEFEKRAGSTANMPVYDPLRDGERGANSHQIGEHSARDEGKQHDVLFVG